MSLVSAIFSTIGATQRSKLQTFKTKNKINTSFLTQQLHMKTSTYILPSQQQQPSLIPLSGVDYMDQTTSQCSIIYYISIQLINL